MPTDIKVTRNSPSVNGQGSKTIEVDPPIRTNYEVDLKERTKYSWSPSDPAITIDVPEKSYGIQPLFIRLQDTLSGILDNISTIAPVVRDFTETLTVSEAISFVIDVSKSENVNISESILTEIVGTLIPVSYQDTITVSDLLQWLSDNGLTETVASTDTLGFDISKVLSETASISDIPVFDVSIVLQDSIIASDSILCEYIQQRTLQDSLSGIIDGRIIVPSVTYGDSYYVDGMVDGVYYDGIYTETSSIDYTPYFFFNFGKFEQDTALVNESLVFDIDMQLQDSLTGVYQIFEYNTTGDGTQENQDTSIVTDSLVTTMTWNRSFVDTVIVTDSFIGIPNYHLSDSVTVTDTGFTIDISLDKQDIPLVTESISYINTKPSSETDSATISELAEILYNKIVSENVTISDSIGPYFDVSQQIPNDGITLSDSVAHSVSVVFVDTAVITDIFNTSGGDQQSLQDSAAVNDTPIFSVDKYLPNEILAVTDVVIAISVEPQYIDNISISDTNFAIDYNKNLSDSTAVVENIVIVSQFNKDFTDTATIDATDFAYVWTVNRAYQDTSIVSDTFTKVWSINKDIQETITSTENIAWSYGKIDQDTAIITDNFTGSYNKVDQDSAIATDSAALSIQVVFTENVTVTDSAVTDTGGDTLNPSDSVTSTESGTANMQDYADAGLFAEDYTGTNYSI